MQGRQDVVCFFVGFPLDLCPGEIVVAGMKMYIYFIFLEGADSEHIEARKALAFCCLNLLSTLVRLPLPQCF